MSSGNSVLYLDAPLHWPLQKETKSEKIVLCCRTADIFTRSRYFLYNGFHYPAHWPRPPPPRQGNSRTEKLCIMGELERERTSNLFFGEEKGKNEMWPSTLKYWIKRWTVAAARNPIDTWNVNLSTRLSQWLKKEKALLCERKVPTSAIFVTYVHICLYPSL